MNKIIAYKIVDASYVADYLKEDWYLFGNPLLDDKNNMVQAIVKYEDENADIRI